MRFTIQENVDAEVVETFLPAYRDSFAPLAALSAQKQVLSDAEFRELMAAPSTLKFCGWTDDQELAALAVVAHDLALVPWLSGPFFARIYPEQHERNAIGTVMTILVTNEHRGQPWIVGLVQAIGAHTVSIDGVALFDCCKHNVEEVQFPQLIASITEDWTALDARLLDYQNYYGYVGISNETIDLSEFQQQTAIDLRVQPAGVQ